MKLMQTLLDYLISFIYIKPKSNFRILKNFD